jgi:hypothetical protein
VSESILDSTKKVLNIEKDYTAFDQDIIMHINSVFSTLNQLGIGPVGGYAIVDAEPTWSAFFGDDPKFNSVKTYVFLKVKLLFDPPGTSYLIQSMERQVQEFEWRINVARENEEWVDPNPLPLLVEEG